jgi:hypothetical protein
MARVLLDLVGNAIRRFLTCRARAVSEARDRDILDAVAEELNREMEDVLSFQADV